MSSDSELWLRRYHPARDGAPKLVCLPHAGGSASFYFPMARGLSPDVDVIAVQYPGRQDRRMEPCMGSIPELADAIVRVLDTSQPIALFGHSMGATLAFEVATRLEQSDATVLHVFASGRRAPSCYRKETVHQRDDEGIIAELRALSGTDSRVLGDEEILRMALPAIRADYRAAETYAFPGGPALRCPVTVLTGDADPKTTLEEARAWERHAEGHFVVRVFSGGHFFLADHQESVLELVRDQLTAGAVHNGSQGAQGAQGN
jgi:surfactin synthase thioesterase subunit